MKLKNRPIHMSYILIGIAAILVVIIFVWAKFASFLPDPESIGKTSERKVSVQVIKPIVQDLDIKLKYPVNMQANLPGQYPSYLRQRVPD